MLYYHINDHLGTTRLVTDPDGAITGSFSYYPFGEAASTYGYAANSQTFTGKLLDSESGLQYFGARYLSNDFARFTSADPASESFHPKNPQSWNRYAYSLDDPVNLIDPNGRDPLDVEAVREWSANEQARLTMLEVQGNLAAGFGDNLTFGAVQWFLATNGANQFVNGNSTSYNLGQAAGVVWWTLLGGAVADSATGVGFAEKELGNITVQSAEFKVTLEGLTEAQKLAQLGGVEGALWRSVQNVFSLSWWRTVAQTTLSTGPTPGAWGGLLGLTTGAGSWIYNWIRPDEPVQRNQP